MHKREIIHNDLKVENIMFNSTGEVRIIDFGLCKHIKFGEDSIDSNGKGFPFNLAPETLIDRKIYKASDIWQAGTILNLFLFMRYPFEDTKDNMVWHVHVFIRKCAYSLLIFILKVLEKIKTGNYNKLPISAEGRDLLDRMFTTDPLKRINCQQILKHPWVTRKFDSSNDRIDFNQEYYGIAIYSRLRTLIHPCTNSLSNKLRWN